MQKMKKKKEKKKKKKKNTEIQKYLNYFAFDDFH